MTVRNPRQHCPFAGEVVVGEEKGEMGEGKAGHGREGGGRLAMAVRGRGWGRRWGEGVKIEDWVGGREEKRKGKEKQKRVRGPITTRHVVCGAERSLNQCSIFSYEYILKIKAINKKSRIPRD